MEEILPIINSLMPLIGIVLGSLIGYYLKTPKDQRIRKYEKSPGYIEYPKAWDYVFSNDDTSAKFGWHKRYWLKIIMKSGTTYGGVWQKDSAASSFPNEEDILLEDVWNLSDKETYYEHVPRGLLVCRDEIAAMEIFQYEEEDHNDER